MAEVAQTNDSATSASFWWVNHKQTSRLEIEGGYLWSPVRERSGNRSQFYDNLRRARPGEFILSYANAQVRHVGCVVDFAFDSVKPTNFGMKGAHWDEFGWLLPLEWKTLPSTVRPADHLEKIVEHLPEKYSPINANTGFGNQKAYLAEISQELFLQIVALAGESAIPGGRFW
ncbi:MAG: hypothetical protein KDB27_09815 [Planctomycetales bacterium]|nr:hypothetical protein [Planctomycetales bacterium]